MSIGAAIPMDKGIFTKDQCLQFYGGQRSVNKGDRQHAGEMIREIRILLVDSGLLGFHASTEKPQSAFHGRMNRHGAILHLMIVVDIPAGQTTKPAFYTKDVLNGGFGLDQ